MMLKRFGMFALLAVCLFAVCLFVIAMGGCNRDDPPLLEEEVPIKFVSANPVSGSTIQNDATITVTFDGIPEGLEVTGGTAILSDKMVTLSGPFVAGSLTLGLKWEGDAVLLSYTVEAPPEEELPAEEEFEEEWEEAASFVSASPAGFGESIPANGSITVFFDNAPSGVAVSAGIPWPFGNTVTISGPFPVGPLVLTITWDDGSHTLNYTVLDVTAPSVTGGRVEDGYKDVDPEWVNTDGLIEIEFSEEVEGNIALQTEGGDDVGWIGEVEGTRGTLELIKGKEIDYETTYVIAGRVSDVAGNILDFRITFVTRIK